MKTGHPSWFMPTFFDFEPAAYMNCFISASVTHRHLTCSTVFPDLVTSLSATHPVIMQLVLITAQPTVIRKKTQLILRTATVYVIKALLIYYTSDFLALAFSSAPDRILWSRLTGRGRDLGSYESTRNGFIHPALREALVYHGIKP